jgi:hypothetical protein
VVDSDFELFYFNFQLIEAWDQDPDNYSKLEQHLKELKVEIEKFKV